MIVVEDTHSCPVCGEVAPCIYSTRNTMDEQRYHNCHMCGSTWKDLTSEKSLLKNS